MSADMNPRATPPARVPPGPPGTGAPARPFLASDAERDEVAAILLGQYAEGRLTAGEYQDRRAAVFAARTWDDLAQQVADLPVRLPFLPPGPMAPPGPAAWRGPEVPPGAAVPAVRGTHPAPGQRWTGDDTLIAILLFVVFPPGAVVYALLRTRGAAGPGARED